jgi:hypothetical protein
MQEAMNFEAQKGLEGTNFQNQNRSIQSGEPIDIANYRQTAN